MTTRINQLTAIVPTGNRVDVIEDCLRSLTWVDELLVVDSFSEDGTLAIAERYADRILQRAYVNSAEQKNWAIPQATHDWVLIVDTDERVSPSLRAEIETVLSAPLPTHVGYKIPRRNFLLNREVRHTGYYPDYQIRLFRRDDARYASRQVHAHVQLNGSCGTLSAALIHYAHRSIDQTVRNLLLRMTTWEAEHRIEHAAGALPRFLPLQLLFRPIAAFFLRYVGQKGYRDGMAGLVLSVLWAIYVALTYIKIWEHSLNLPTAWWSDEGQNDV